MKYSIRPLKQSDYDAWLPLWTAYLTFYHTSIEEEVTKHTFARLVEEDSSAAAFVAVAKDHSLCGLAHYLFHITTWSTKPVCYMQDLYVSPQARGEGVGEALVKEVKKASEKHEAAFLHWLTEYTNEPACKLYDKLASKTKFIRYKWEGL